MTSSLEKVFLLFHTGYPLSEGRWWCWGIPPSCSVCSRGHDQNALGSPQNQPSEQQVA